MPESKHRRKGRTRPRPQHVAGPPVKPKPSPRWVPVTGITLVGLGILAVILTYVPGLIERNEVLVAGFALMAVGLGFLMRWR